MVNKRNHPKMALFQKANYNLPRLINIQDYINYIHINPNFPQIPVSKHHSITISISIQTFWIIDVFKVWLARRQSIPTACLSMLDRKGSHLPWWGLIQFGVCFGMGPTRITKCQWKLQPLIQCIYIIVYIFIYIYIYIYIHIRLISGHSSPTIRMDPG